METPVDQGGRIVIPKALRDRLSLVFQDLAPDGQTARLVRRRNKLVAVSDTTVTDEDVFTLIDAGRR